MRNIKPKRINPAEIMMSKPSEPKPIYPRITLNSKELPEIKDWTDGETYRIEMEVRQVSKRTSDESEYGNESSFEIRKIEVDDDENDEEDN